MKKFCNSYNKAFGSDGQVLSWLIENKEEVLSYLTTVSIKKLFSGRTFVQFIDPNTGLCSVLSLEDLKDFCSSFNNGDHI